jgi:DNA repair exonuclease SbcCD ATPase subunit
MAEDALRENIRRLAEIETEIEEISKMERVFERISELEVALEKISDQCRSFVSQSDLREIVRELKHLKETKDASDRYLETAERSLRDQIGKLAEVDSNIIKDVEKLGKSLERVNELSGKIDRLYSQNFVDEKRLDELAYEVREKTDELRKRLESKLVSQDLAIKRIVDLISGFVRKEDMMELRDGIRDAKIANENLARKLEAQGETLRENISRLSEVDRRIIDDLGKMEKIIERINEVDRNLRRVSESILELPSQKELSELRSVLDERIEELSKNLSRIDANERTIAKLNESLGNFVDKTEIGEIREEIKRYRELPSMLEERREKEESLRKDIERLSRVDSEIISELAKLSKLYGKIHDHDSAIRKLREQSESWVTREELREILEIAPKQIRILREEIEKLALRKEPKKLIEEKEEILKVIDALRDDYEKGTITKEAYEEALRGSIKRLSDIDAELEDREKSGKILSDLLSELESLKANK